VSMLVNPRLLTVLRVSRSYRSVRRRNLSMMASRRRPAHRTGLPSIPVLQHAAAGGQSYRCCVRGFKVATLESDVGGKMVTCLAILTS
jgi:hypothetical protein